MAGKIKGITIEFNGNVTPLTKALEDVNKRSGQATSELKKINSALKFNPNSTELLAQKQEVLGENIKATAEKLKHLKDAQAEVDERFKRGEIPADKYRDFKREIEKTESQLKGYKTQLDNVTKEQDKLGDSQKRLDKLLKGTKKNINDYRSLLGDKLVEAIKNGTATSKDLDKAFNIIGKSALDSKVDVQELKEALDALDDNVDVSTINDKIKNIGNAANAKKDGLASAINKQNIATALQSAQQVGNQIKGFAKNSFDAFREIDSGLDTIIKKTGIYEQTEVNALTQIYKDLVRELPIENLNSFGEAIGEVNTQFGFTGQTLKENSSYLLKYADITDSDVTTATINAKQVMSAFNLTADKLPLTLDVLANVGQKTGISVDTLSDSLTKNAPIISSLGLSYENSALLIGKLSQNGLDSEKVFSALTKAQANYVKDGKSLQTGLEELRSKLEGAKNETEKLSIVNAVFGNKNGAYMLKALQENKLALEDVSLTAEDYAGTVTRTFEATIDPIDQQNQVTKEVKLAMSELGDSISQTLVPVLKQFVDIVKSIGEFFSGLPEPVQQFIVVLGVLFVALTALSPVITLLAVASAPIAGIILAIMAAIAAVIVVIMNWETAWNGLVDVFNWVCQSIVSGFSAVGNILQGVMNGVVGFFSGAWNNVSNIVSNVWNSIASVIGDSINTAKNFVKKAIDGIIGFFNFQFKWPHIPLPHFSISGSLNPLDWISQGLPKIGVEWYAKGGILTRPTIFGANGNNLMVGGEAGKEAVLPLNTKNLTMIGKGIAETMKEIEGYDIKIYIDNLSVKDDDDIQEIVRRIVTEIERQKERERRLRGLA